MHFSYSIIEIRLHHKRLNDDQTLRDKNLPKFVLWKSNVEKALNA